MEREPLLGMLPEELQRHLSQQNLAVTEQQARRIFAQVVGRGAPLERLPRLASRVRDAVETCCSRDALTIVEREQDADGFTRLLLRSPDGALSEAVRIPLARAGRFTVCLSSQVGCAMGCDFCATGRIGLSRNLEAWEMVAAFDAVRRVTTEGRITGAVFMGQGEPFHNYDAVIQAARILSHPNGGAIAQKAITISTVGLVPAIRRYTAEGHRYRLIISLHSLRDEVRRRLLPVVGRRSLDDLVAAIRERAEATGQPVTLAWTLMGGVNDGLDEVRRMRELLEGIPVILNLIDVNDDREDGYRRSTEAEREAFRDALSAAGIPMRRRYSGGRRAACGTLAGRGGGSCELHGPA